MNFRGFRRKKMASASAVVLLSLSACGGAPSAQVGLVTTQPIPAPGNADFAGSVDPDYVLRPSDVLKISVFRETDLSQDSVAIAANGDISVPLIGQVRVAGMTLQSLEVLLENELNARYLRNPDVTVNVIDYASHQVTVEGAVQQTGVFSFKPGTRLSGGIALARGLDRVAKGSDVAVFRQTPEGMFVAKFDYRAVQGGTMLDPVLEPGDRIVVGTSGLSQFWQDLLKAIPVFALFTRI